MTAQAPTDSTTPAWYSVRTPSGVLLWILVIGTAIRLAAAHGIGFANGESYYYTSVRNPSLSYFDQPPLGLWIPWLFMKLFGVSRVILRLPFILMFAGTTWMMYRMGKRLFSPWAGAFAALALNMSFVFTIPAASWIQPDGPLLFFWMACALVVIEILFRDTSDIAALRRDPRLYGLWALGGVLLGLTTLSKYHAAFLLAGVGIYALTRKEQRHWLLHPGPYIALIITGLFALPIILWNMDHDWASFVFQGGRAGSKHGIQIGKFALSIVGQMVWLLPWIWIPLVWQGVLSFRRGYPGTEAGESPAGRARWFCLCTAILPVGFFTLVALWADIGLHFHWQAPGYMMLFPALGASVDAALRNEKWRKWIRRWIALSVTFSAGSVLIMALHVSTGVWTFYGPAFWGGLVGEKEDPTLEALDYDELRTALKERGFWDQEDLFVFSNRWHFAGKVDWALRGHWPIFAWHHDPRNTAFFYDQEDMIGKDGLFIVREIYSYDDNSFKPYFESVERLEDVTITRGGKPVITITLYLCKNLQRPYPRPYPKKKAAE